MSLALKVANGRNSKKTQTVGNATLDLVRRFRLLLTGRVWVADVDPQADFYRDGLRVDKMIPIAAGSNPTTLKVTIEARATSNEVLRDLTVARRRNGCSLTASSSCATRWDGALCCPCRAL